MHPESFLPSTFFRSQSMSRHKFYNVKVSKRIWSKPQHEDQTLLFVTLIGWFTLWWPTVQLEGEEGFSFNFMNILSYLINCSTSLQGHLNTLLQPITNTWRILYEQITSSTLLAAALFFFTYEGVNCKEHHDLSDMGITNLQISKSFIWGLYRVVNSSE